MRDMATISHVHKNRVRALRATRIALYVRDLPSVRVTARAMLAYTGKHYHVANTLFLLHAFTCKFVKRFNTISIMHDFLISVNSQYVVSHMTK